MNRNVRIAKELVRIAKSMIAMPAMGGRPAPNRMNSLSLMCSQVCQMCMTNLMNNISEFMIAYGFTLHNSGQVEMYTHEWEKGGKKVIIKEKDDHSMNHRLTVSVYKDGNEILSIDFVNLSSFRDEIIDEISGILRKFADHTKMNSEVNKVVDKYSKWLINENSSNISDVRNAVRQ